MKTARKPCARCQSFLAPKGNRYCDSCEAIVREEMRAKKYLEERHLRSVNFETGKQIPGAR